MTNDDDDADSDDFDDDHDHYPCCVIILSREQRQPEILSSCEAGVARRKKSNRRAYRDQGAAKWRRSGVNTGGWGRRRPLEEVGKERRNRTRRRKSSGRKNTMKRQEERGTNIKSENSFREIRFTSK
jgi:hypothetical protein